MKKNLRRALAVCLCAVFFAACSSPMPLSFYAPWTTSESHPANFSETAVYDVQKTTNYRAATSENATDDYTAQENEYFSADYSGTYTVTVTSTNGTQLESEFDIIMDSSNELYRIETDLSMRVTYTVKATKKEYVSEEGVHSVAYFRSNNQSLAPIYSVKTYDSTSVSVSNDGEVRIVGYDYSTRLNWLFGNGRAQLVIADAEDEGIPEGMDEDVYERRYVGDSTTEIGYDDRATLDNETLYFAIRGIPPTQEFSSTFKIIDTAYQSVQSVSVASAIAATYAQTWTLTQGSGEAQSIERTPACLVTVRRGDSTYSGSSHHCYYQLETTSAGSGETTQENETVSAPYRAFLLRIVTKLPYNLGALDYSLQSVTVSE